MNTAELVWQHAVAGHGEPDAGLSVLADKDGGDHAEDGSEEDGESDPMEAVGSGGEGNALQGVDDGCAVAGD